MVFALVPGLINSYLHDTFGSGTIPASNMSTVYRFKISSPLTYVKAVLLSLLVPAIFMVVVYLVFSTETLKSRSDLFFFIGGGLWFIAFVTSIYTSAEQMDCEIGEAGLTMKKKSKSLFYKPGTIEVDWTQLHSYSIHEDGNGILLIFSLKDFSKRKWITLPYINNDSREIRKFLSDFQRYASYYNAHEAAPDKKIKRGKSFSETRIARIIGYFVIVYLVFITVVKVSGYDQGRIAWSNIASTYFFATMYLTFVFWRKTGRER